MTSASATCAGWRTSGPPRFAINDTCCNWQYVDTVVGALVSQLGDAGLYDDALLIVTADHGTSLRSGIPFLRATEASFVDIAAVPLFFKNPGQRQGETVDANVETSTFFPRWRPRWAPG